MFGLGKGWKLHGSYKNFHQRLEVTWKLLKLPSTAIFKIEKTSINRQKPTVL